MKVNWRSLWLAHRGDALYAGSGVIVAAHPDASSSHVGEEVDLYVMRTLTPRLTAQVGYGHLFPGAYLKQASQGSTRNIAYLMWILNL
jgi:hypothetical protein